MTDGLAGFEHSAGRRAGADLFGDTMESQRRAIRTFDLANAEAGG